MPCSRFCKCVMTLLFVLACLASSSCSYMRNVLVQVEYGRLQSLEPSVVNLRHLIDSETVFVYGTLNHAGLEHQPNSFSIAAFSNRFQEFELVDVMQGVRANTHYGLNLPPGEYQLLVFSDLDSNGHYEASEVVGERKVNIPAHSKHTVVGGMDITLFEPTDKQLSVKLNAPASIPARSTDEAESLFYPTGTIRDMFDPIFDRDVAMMGLYHPAAFLEKARTMFYALEEDVSYKIPVIFVHGIGGTPIEFKRIVEKVDRTRFKPWFFYYPSGSDLDQIALFFQNLFLSGNVIPVDEKLPIIVVAHSMGGLVVKEALNLQKTPKNRILFLSMASPFDGHPGAAKGQQMAPMVLPAWRDLNPDGKFIKNLYRKPAHPLVEHRLIYAYKNPKMAKFGENSDGVVQLSSQLRPAAQKQAFAQIGFDSSHTKILAHEEAIDYLIDQISRAKTGLPPEHYSYLLAGGFVVNEKLNYSEKQKHSLRYFGAYMRALAENKIKPLNSYQERFLLAIRGERKPIDHVDKAWNKFITHEENWRSLIPSPP